MNALDLRADHHRLLRDYRPRRRPRLTAAVVAVGRWFGSDRPQELVGQ